MAKDLIKQLLTLLVSLFLTNCDQKDVSDVNSSGQLVEKADAIFQGHVNDGNIAGASVLIYKGEEKVLDKSYGYASLELQTPMPENAVFEIGSVTKQFTAAAILKLEEEQKLSLKDDITKYVDFNTQGKKITIQQLLNHTSGIASYTEIPEFWTMSYHSYHRDSMISLVEKAGFLFEPGEKMIYNNSAYFLLGLIIEEVTGKSYEEFLNDIFFNPLGMNNTYYCSNSEIVKNKAYGYSESPTGLIQKDHIDHTWPYAAGSLCSTTNDLITWMKALHNGKVFSNEYYAKFITPLTLNDGTVLRYAMGIIHYDDFGNETIEHSGGINGFSSASRYYPDDDLYVVCLKNSTGPNFIAETLVSDLIWDLIEKKEYPLMELESGVNGYSGSYKGLVRGQQVLLNINVTQEGLILKYENDTAADTIEAYLGNKTWADGNHLITLKENEITLDNLYGYYRLKKLTSQYKSLK